MENGEPTVDPESTSQRSAEERLQLLQRFARIAAEEQTLDDLLWHLTESIGELFGFDDCVIYLRYGSILQQKAAYGVKNAGRRAILSPISIALGEGIVGTVALTGRAELVRDLERDPRYINDQVAGLSELAVPIVFQGEVIGVLDSEASRPGVFQPGDLELFAAVADVAAVRIAWLSSERGQIRQERVHRERQIEGLGRLGANLAHEVNNSLAVVSLNAELLRAGGVAENQEDFESLAAIEDSVERIGSLVRRLQTFSLGGAPRSEPLDLEEILAAALRSLDDFPEIESCVHIAGAVPRVLGDEAQLQQALEQLLLNAAQATHGRGAVEVQLGTISLGRGAATEVFMIVSDDGPGLSEEARKHLFAPFYSSRGPGRGLGLATAYRVLTRHGGTLELVDSLSGATFELRLPIAAGEPSSGLASGSGRDLRVLILDDEIGLRRVLEQLLVHLGHRVHSVSDGAQVAPVWIEALESGEPFDLALLDLSIPSGVGGLEALRRLRTAVAERGSDDPEAASPAVVMSGYSDDPVLARPQEFGFRGRLEKPFDLQSLRRALSLAATPTPANDVA